MSEKVFLSIVTFNRRDVLAETLDAIKVTCEPGTYELLVSDNASSDGTPEMLRAREANGELRAWCLPTNMGTSGGRNAHWHLTAGYDAIRMDDKVKPLCSDWLPVMQRQAHEHHCIVGPPYDPTVRSLEACAPCIAFVAWKPDQGAGGPMLFVPGELTAALGGIDELDPECVYGWDDCLQIERGKLLGWGFGFSLRVPVAYLAQANPARRAGSMRWHEKYMTRRAEYENAERDLFIDPTTTRGYQAGLRVRGERESE